MHRSARVLAAGIMAGAGLLSVATAASAETYRDSYKRTTYQQAWRNPDTLPALRYATPTETADWRQVQRANYVEQFYENHRRDSGYWDWKRYGANWTKEDYARWYVDHGRRTDDATTAALFGVGQGTPPAVVVAAPPPPPPAPPPVVVVDVPPAGGYAPRTPEWYRYCTDRYPSFDPQTGTFIGMEGERRFCE